LTVFLAANAAAQQCWGPEPGQLPDGRVIIHSPDVKFKFELGPESCDSSEGLFARLSPESGFYAETEVLFLGRGNQSKNQAVVIDLDHPSGEGVILTARDFRFPFEPTVRDRLGFRLNECQSFEVGYMGLFEAGSRRTVTGDGNLAIPGDLGVASNVFFGSDDMDITYSSQLQSVELNSVKRCECCCCDDCRARLRCHWREWFAGFRYLRLTEEFNIRSTDLQEGTGNYNIRTSNDLFGAQMGMRWGRSSGRLGCELTGKTGIFGNACQQRQYVTDFPPPFMLRPLTRSEGGQFAFVGELGVTLRYQLTDIWAARGGYNLMLIEGVALAPDQLDFTNTSESGTRLVSTGSVFLHGVSAGLEARW
jgi:hypothetical protein